MIAIARGIPASTGAPRSPPGATGSRPTPRSTSSAARAGGRSRPTPTHRSRSCDRVRTRRRGRPPASTSTPRCRSIPEEFRVAVVLRDLCDLDYAEIAEVLDVPPGTVRSRISAWARAILVERLGSDTDPPTPSREPACPPPNVRTTMADDDATATSASAQWLEVEPLDEVTRRRLVSTAHARVEASARRAARGRRARWRWIAGRGRDRRRARGRGSRCSRPHGGSDDARRRRPAVRRPLAAARPVLNAPSPDARRLRSTSGAGPAEPRPRSTRRRRRLGRTARPRRPPDALEARPSAGSPPARPARPATPMPPRRRSTSARDQLPARRPSSRSVRAPSTVAPRPSCSCEHGRRLPFARRRARRSVRGTPPL